MLGLLIGSIVGGRLGDKFGRKNTMLVASFIMVPATLGSGFVPSYGAYAFLRWVICVCMPVVWVNNTVYMIETFTPKAGWKILQYILGPINSVLMRNLKMCREQIQDLHNSTDTESACLKSYKIGITITK